MDFQYVFALLARFMLQYKILKTEKNIFLLPGIALGFEVMVTNESPNGPFTTFKTRFEKGY